MLSQEEAEETRKGIVEYVQNLEWSGIEDLGMLLIMGKLQGKIKE